MHSTEREWLSQILIKKPSIKPGSFALVKHFIINTLRVIYKYRERSQNISVKIVR